MALGSLGPTPSTLGFRRPSRSPLVSGQTRLAGPPEGPSLLSAAAGVWPARAPQPAGEGQVHSWPYSYRRLVSCRLSLLRDSVSPRRTKTSNPSVRVLTPSRRRQKADLGQDWQSVDQSQELGCALADQQLGAEGSWTRLKGAFLPLRTSRDFHFSGPIGWTTEIWGLRPLFNLVSDWPSRRDGGSRPRVPSMLIGGLCGTAGARASARAFEPALGGVAMGMRPGRRLQLVSREGSGCRLWGSLLSALSSVFRQGWPRRNLEAS